MDHDGKQNDMTARSALVNNEASLDREQTLQLELHPAIPSRSLSALRYFLKQGDASGRPTLDGKLKRAPTHPCVPVASYWPATCPLLPMDPLSFIAPMCSLKQ